jgi:hypothetical protein
MRALPWILGGGAGGIAAYYWYRGRGAVPSTNVTSNPTSEGSRSEPLPGRWVWPVGVWHGRKPEISDGFASKRRSLWPKPEHRTCMLEACSTPGGIEAATIRLLSHYQRH